MKDKSNKYTISDELLAAFLDGNVSAAECRQVLEAINSDTQLRELLQISLIVDAEMGLQSTRDNYLPMAALAAEYSEENICCLECEKYVMDRFSITYDEQKLIDLAKEIKKIVDDKSKYTDWSKKDDIKAELKVDIILKLAEFKYPPVTQDEVYKEIFEQAENFKKSLNNAVNRWFTLRDVINIVKRGVRQAISDI